MRDRDAQFLRKVVAEADVIAQLIDGFDLAAFCADERTKRAVSMTLINIGELVKGLSEEVRVSNPHVPWRGVTGLRDMAAHKYQTLRQEDIWETVTNDVPPLRMQIIELLDNNGE